MDREIICKYLYLETGDSWIKLVNMGKIALWLIRHGDGEIRFLAKIKRKKTTVCNVAFDAITLLEYDDVITGKKTIRRRLVPINA